MTNPITSPAFAPIVIGGFAFVNLTPHPIVYRGEDGADITVPPSGHVLRLGQTVRPSFENELFVATQFTEPEGHEPFEDWMYEVCPQEKIIGIVSGMFLDGLADICLRNDEDDFIYNALLMRICAPLTDGSAIRNEKGHIVAVRNFRVAHRYAPRFD